MDDNHLEKVIAIYNHQHDVYTKLSNVVMDFPIKLTLFINSLAAIASILYMKLFAESSGDPTFLATIKYAAACFAAGMACSLIASYLNWNFYRHLAEKKRKLLKKSLDADCLKTAIQPFFDQLDQEPLSSLPSWSFKFVVISFLSFVTGSTFLTFPL